MLSFRFEVDEESKTDSSRLFKFSDLLVAFCVTKELVCLKLKIDRASHDLKKHQVTD